MKQGFEGPHTIRVPLQKTYSFKKKSLQKCFENVTKQMDDYSSQQNNNKHWEGENLISIVIRLQSLLCSVLYNYNYNTK